MLICSANSLRQMRPGFITRWSWFSLAAIVEAAFAQIIYRAQNYNREGVRVGISELEQAEIADKTIDKFNTIIDIALEEIRYRGSSSGADVYDELHKLRTGIVE